MRRPRSGPEKNTADFLLLERVRRRPLHRADAGLRLFLSRRDPRGVLRRAARARGRGPGGRRAARPPIPGIARPGNRPAPAIRRPCTKRRGRASNWPRGPPRWDSATVEVRDGILRATSTNGDPAFSSPLAEASRQPLCEGGRRDACEPAGRRRPAFLVDSDRAAATEAASVSVPTVADGRWHRYTFAVGEQSALGRMHYVAAARSGHAGRRDRGTEVDPTRIDCQLQFSRTRLHDKIRGCNSRGLTAPECVQYKSS